MIHSTGQVFRNVEMSPDLNIQLFLKLKAATLIGYGHFYVVTPYLGTTLTNQNSIPEEIKSRLRSGNACYHSVQNLLSSRLLSKNLKIKIYRTIILPVVLYGCET